MSKIEREAGVPIMPDDPARMPHVPIPMPQPRPAIPERDPLQLPWVDPGMPEKLGIPPEIPKPSVPVEPS